ncbi:hypothetical protein Pcinc_013815 [Petrolisthes cinctipes]|uniref:Uncharacterized protein n=1 Tax=Petrolisthes cinctipes TaxID=88211 RepID=A0AAE1KTY5_PETCI|nr:hypothetical protein Pcinc_013815 [Petrolisthes cinctipes]
MNEKRPNTSGGGGGIVRKTRLNLTKKLQWTFPARLFFTEKFLYPTTVPLPTSTTRQTPPPFHLAIPSPVTPNKLSRTAASPPFHHNP